MPMTYKDFFSERCKKWVMEYFPGKEVDIPTSMEERRYQFFKDRLLDELNLLSRISPDISQSVESAEQSLVFRNKGGDIVKIHPSETMRLFSGEYTVGLPSRVFVPTHQLVFDGHAWIDPSVAAEDESRELAELARLQDKYPKDQP